MVDVFVGMPLLEACSVVDVLYDYYATLLEFYLSISPPAHRYVRL